MDKKAMAYQTTHSNNLPEWLAKIYVCSEVWINKSIQLQGNSWEEFVL
jgi:hypothetical protein